MPEDYLDKELASDEIWWPPRTDQKVRGRLAYKDTINLSLFSAVDTTDEPVIFGNSNKFGRCTIFEAYSKENDNHSLPAPSSRFQATYAILGVHCESREEPIFNNISFHFPELCYFLEHDAFSTERHPDGKSTTTYTPQQSFRTSILDDSCTVYIGSGMSELGGGMESLTLIHRPSISFYFKSPESFNGILSLSDKVIRLFTLLLGKRTYLTEFNYACPDPMMSEQILQRRSRPPKPEWCFPIALLNRIKAYWPNLLEKWLGNEDIHTTALLLHHGMSDEGFLEDRFLSLAQALETYCRLNQPDNQYMDEDSYQKIQQKLLNSLPEATPRSFRQSFTHKLKFANQFGLKKRIKLELDGLDDKTVRLFCLDKSKFADKVVATRNWLVHQGEREPSQTFSNHELFPAAMSLQTLMLMLIYKWLGCPEHEVRQWLMDSDQLNKFNLVHHELRKGKIVSPIA
ncbi:hypothetical protein KOR42_36170 [Thalassoglobus neptunius]|uniref:Uncharacterized protein n=2 Tax=Thalassoglobus neptunius TaxID=1938619 RepID=A0A5C5WJ74_9PLAN|nr:hypothetical protein KOR42_36170 [Thalassoglobus neptunius]